MACLLYGKKENVRHSTKADQPYGMMIAELMYNYAEKHKSR